MKKKNIIILLILISISLFTGCKKEIKELCQIDIVYTNDIHTYIYNNIKETEDGVNGLRLSNVSALVKDLKNEGKNVLLVDAGDSIQGSAYGIYDYGSSVIDIMNACGFQLTCPGNHEFDYGMDVFMHITEKANYPYISCNFKRTSDGSNVFDGSKIFDLNGTKVAFIGISSVDSIASSTPKYFQDEDGNFIYTFGSVEDPTSLYKYVQDEIDSVKNKVDYVIALGHLGVAADDEKRGISSTAVIRNVEGLDAFIDGHSHTTVENQIVKDKVGNDVVLTQTGADLTAVGHLIITKEGQVSTKLITGYENVDENVKALEEKLYTEVQKQMGTQIAELENILYINNPDIPGQRLIRAQEMNAGDFVADSIYWYFNEIMNQDCDFVIANGGGVRCQLDKGILTYADVRNLCPFGNQVCMIEVTGQEILDALEKGASSIGIWDYEWDSPAENGGFLQVAGLKYEIDASVKSSVETDSYGNFVSVNGEYRVKNIQYYNKDKKQYEDLELDKVYKLGGINYLLRNSGNGLCMFSDNTLITNFAGEDSLILTLFARSFTTNGNLPIINSANCPLTNYENYGIDYENPYGANRIIIKNLSY